MYWSLSSLSSNNEKKQNKNLELDPKPALKPQRNWVKNWLKSIIVDVASHFINDFFMAKFSLFCESKKKKLEKHVFFFFGVKCLCSEKIHHTWCKSK
jgi:hypothetical protein